jgi:RNA polymerase sigma factor (sigma-70 family)
MSDTDLQLLARYSRDRAEDAFAEIVRRHLDLVHSAALRQVRSPQLAEEVAQSVFTDLARNAHRLTGSGDASSPEGGSDAPSLGSLTPWLYQVTRRTAIDVVRREARRQLREQIATEMNAMNATTADWTHIEPLLDEAMSALDETDRAAVLLRYFENKSLREVGATLGTSDDAAQKRVSRAVERLREFFTKRGVTVSASGLVVVISANAVQAAPVGLAVTISTAAALVGTTIATTATATAIKTIAMTTLQKTLITVTIAAAVGTGIYEAHQNSKLRDENESQQQQIAQLKLESESFSNRLPVVADTKSPPDEHLNELLRLRGEVGVLRRQKTELENSLANVRNSQPRRPNPVTEQQPPPTLSDDYPKTADGATRGIFESFARGDWDAFYAKFDVDGGREFWDKAFTDEMKSNLLGMEVVSIGTPTNSFGPNMWFVPYTIRFKDGNQKTLRLHVAQDPRTQRWILKGGF